MQATFFAAIAARDAVVQGDLGAAKFAAKALAEYDYSKVLPAEWQHWTKQMQQRAGEVVLAAGLDDAAQSVAALGLACGDCHAHLRQGPYPEGDDPALAWKDPPEDLPQRMYRHETGMDQLWLGLIMPSEDAWRNGTITLTRAPLEPVFRNGDEVAPSFETKLEEIRGLAKRARVAGSHSERAQVYGDLLARCASCHVVAGVAKD